VATKEYIKLTSTRKRAGFAIFTVSRAQVWRGPDHLLLVITNGYTETYKRFYFRDIQSLLIRRTDRQKIIALVTGLLTAIFGAVAIVTTTIEVRWVFGILAITTLIPFVLNLLLGQTCICHLRTAVQTEEISPLSRVNRARRFLEKVRPLIAEAQGELTVEEVDMKMREFVSQAGSSGTISSPTVSASNADIPPVIG